MKHKMLIKYCLLFFMPLSLLVPVRADALTPVTKDPASPLAVSIAVPEQEGIRRLLLSNKSPHFFVTIRNISLHPVSIYGEDSSWGSYNLMLEINTVGGKTLEKPLIVKRGWGVDRWFANVAYVETLMPGDEIVRDVRVQVKPSSAFVLGDGIYRPFPLPNTADMRTVRMRAVFMEEEDSHIARVHVWSGQAKSEFRDYEVVVTSP